MSTVKEFDGMSVSLNMRGELIFRCAHYSVGVSRAVCPPCEEIFLEHIKKVLEAR